MNKKSTSQRQHRHQKDRKPFKRKRTLGELTRGAKSKEQSAQRGSQPAPSQTVVGVVGKAKFGWTLEVADRKDKAHYVIRGPAKAESHAGELVAAHVLPSTKQGRHEVEITHSLGDPNNPKNISLIAILQNEIPLTFPTSVVEEAELAQPVTLKGREDLRQIPFVTIDGADARDFDDAVFAEADGKGWHLMVAIADVAHYVQAGSSLDREAYKRGNSTYFPDRVVPMLPEALSNELCSLKPNVDRACLAVHMWIDSKGELTRWKFVRGVIKSHARLTYEQVQAAMDGDADGMTQPLLNPVIRPLYAAYACLMSARVKRGTLELELPERKVVLDNNGNVKAIANRERLDSHKLIEEFMICANVAAAAQLEGKGGICLYRVHDKPSEIKLDALRDFLDSIGISLVPAKQLHPRMLTQILENAAGGEHAQVINEVMLRSQAQAIYSPDNIGHFGLALAKYAHFTSPIRRYADLIVHRGLIRACSLGPDGLTDEDVKRLEDIGEHISTTERRSATAERDVVDRYTTMFLVDKVGTTHAAHVSGVARFGLFARLDETGADGIIPFNALPRDYYDFDEKRHALIGQRHKRVYQLAAPLQVRIETIDRLTGSMSLSVIEPESAHARGKSGNKPHKHKSRR